MKLEKEELIKMTLENITDYVTKTTYRDTLLKIYEYDLYFSINECLNNLKKHYGSGDKFKNIFPNSNNFEDLIISNMYKTYTEYMTDYNGSITLLEQELNTSPLSISFEEFINSYQEDIKELKLSKKNNNNFDRSDFIEKYFLSLRNCQKYCKLISNKICHIKKKDIQKANINAVSLKHINYIKEYINYLTLNHKLNMYLNAKHSTNHHSIHYYFREHRDDILKVCAQRLSIETIELLYNFSLKDSSTQSIIHMWLIPIKNTFNNNENLKGKKWGSFIYEGQNYITKISKLKTNIDKHIAQINFNELQMMNNVIEDFKKTC